MRARTAVLGAILVLAGMDTARAQDGISGFFIAPQVSTLGLGVEGGYRINEYFGVRGAANFLNLDRDLSTDNIDFDGKARLGSFGATADLFPFGGGFRLSGGLRVNDNHGDLTGTADRNVTLNGNTYTPAQIGRVDSHVEFSRISPYVGIGWSGTIFSPNVYFAADLGVLFQGDPKVSLSATGAAANPQLQADIVRVQRDVEDKVNRLAVYPVVSFSIGYRF
jgi:hypothetical protein